MSEVVHIDIEEVNGDFYASSVDAPGLHITATTMPQLYERCERALVQLYALNRATMIARVEPLAVDVLVTFVSEEDL